MHGLGSFLSAPGMRPALSTKIGCPFRTAHVCVFQKPPLESGTGHRRAALWAFHGIARLTRTVGDLMPTIWTNAVSAWATGFAPTHSTRSASSTASSTLTASPSLTLSSSHLPHSSAQPPGLARLLRSRITGGDRPHIYRASPPRSSIFPHQPCSA